MKSWRVWMRHYCSCNWNNSAWIKITKYKVECLSVLPLSKGIFIQTYYWTQPKNIVHIRILCNFYMIPVKLKNSDNICSFMQRMLFKSTGKILVVLVVSRVRLVPGSRENQRDEKSHPDSAAETRSWYNCRLALESKIILSTLYIKAYLDR